MKADNTNQSFKSPEASVDRLKKLRSSLIEAGLCPDALESIEIEMAANDCPPGFLGKLKGRTKKLLRNHYGHLKGELFETSEIFCILKEKIVKKKALDAEEKSKIKAQMSDLVKMFPAGMFTALNACLPVPGTSLLTPLLLAKMKLLPSRWRDAHVLEKLRAEGKKLTPKGIESEQLVKLDEALDKQRKKQDAVSLNANLLTHWDVNRNGEWDRDEKIAYRDELKKLGEIIKRKAMVQNWFIRLCTETWGPFPIGRIMNVAPELDEDLMVCWAGKSGWVDIQDLYEGKPQV